MAGGKTQERRETLCIGENIGSSGWWSLQPGRKWGRVMMRRDKSEDVGRDLLTKSVWSRAGKFENCFEDNGEPWKDFQQESSLL